MKLYYSPGACSLHPHITLREAGVPFELVRVDLRSHRVSDGSDYYAINPKGYIPSLRLDDGSLLTEGAIIDQYVADLEPEKNLVPANGTMARYRVQEWLHFIGTEVHKAFGPIFGNDEAAKEVARTRVGKRFDLIEKTLSGQPYLAGDHFTVADAYLYNMTRWATYGQMDLGKWPGIKAFAARVEARPAVQEALAAEKS